MKIILFINTLFSCLGSIAVFDLCRTAFLSASTHPALFILIGRFVIEICLAVAAFIVVFGIMSKIELDGFKMLYKIVSGGKNDGND